MDIKTFQFKALNTSRRRKLQISVSCPYVTLQSTVRTFIYLFIFLALQPPLGVVFYSPLAGFSLLAYEVS